MNFSIKGNLSVANVSGNLKQNFSFFLYLNPTYNFKNMFTIPPFYSFSFSVFLLPGSIVSCFDATNSTNECK